MMYRCLAEFLEALGQTGELTRVETETDSALQVSEMASQMAKTGGAALLFGAVRGHDLPVLCNLLATEGRICRAVGVASLDELTDRIARLLDTTASEGWLDRLKGGLQPTGALNAIAPRKVKAAACQQIVRLGNDIDLNELPLLQSAAEETGRTMTAAAVFSADPDSHRSVMDRFDVQRLDRTRLAICWAADDEHARLLGEYRAREHKMPLAIVLGGDPAFLTAIAAPLPPDSDFCAIAGLLRGKSLDVVAGRGVDLDLPAEAEIVLEGFVDPTQPPVQVGPICGPMGRCAPPRFAQVLQVTALTHRANPIYVATPPCPPPNEASTLARAMQRAFLPVVRRAMPDLVDYDLPEFAAARHWAAVAIQKTYPGQGRRAAHAAWGLRPLRFAKMLVVVDEDVNVHDTQAVLAAIAMHVRPDRDVFSERGLADPFDLSAFGNAMSEKMAFDATRKSPSDSE